MEKKKDEKGKEKKKSIGEKIKGLLKQYKFLVFLIIMNFIIKITPGLESFVIRKTNAFFQGGTNSLDQISNSDIDAFFSTIFSGIFGILKFLFNLIF